MIQFRDVRYQTILDIPSLTIETGGVTAITGPSGSGKSTLLKLLNKLISPTSGSILLDGIDLSSIDSVLHRRDVVMLRQSPELFPGNIRDNLVIGLRFRKNPLPPDEDLLAALQTVRLEKALDADTKTLSGGERQRLALARVLLLDANIILLDEPSSALDESTAKVIFETLTSYARDHHKTLITVTHHADFAQRYSDRVISLVGGRIVEGGAV